MKHTLTMYRITSLQALTFLTLCGCVLSTSTRKDYTGYQVLQVKTKNVEEVKFLRNLQLTDDNLYFGSRPSSVGRPVQIMVSPERITEIANLLSEKELEFSLHISNVQSILDPLWRGIDSRMDKNGKMPFNINDFNALDDIYSWLISLVSQCRSGLTCQMTSLGTSYNNKAINIFRISKSGAGRKAIYIDATAQSSDWISTSTALHILNALALGTSSNAISLTDDYDWHIIPVVNPDGYDYSFVNDRFWLKNRRPNGQCYGTNLNVNFDNRWGVEGVTHSPCNNEFCGTGAASEPETRLIQNELRRLAPTLRAALSLHAYGNMWSFSYGYTQQHAGEQCAQTVDHSTMMAISNIAADATQSTYGTTWLRGSVCEIVAPVSGIAVDFTKESAGVHYAFALNLRGDSFVIDKSQIGLAFNEVWNGIVAMINSLGTV